MSFTYIWFIPIWFLFIRLFICVLIFFWVIKIQFSLNGSISTTKLYVYCIMCYTSIFYMYFVSVSVYKLPMKIDDRKIYVCDSIRNWYTERVQWNASMITYTHAMGFTVRCCVYMVRFRFIVVVVATLFRNPFTISPMLYKCTIYTLCECECVYLLVLLWNRQYIVRTFISSKHTKSLQSSILFYLLDIPKFNRFISVASAVWGQLCSYLFNVLRMGFSHAIPQFHLCLFVKAKAEVVE